MVLHKGEIAEMKTGEGKTLVAVLPAYLNALSGKGVHIVTVNDYLARRDCEWVGQVPRFLGLQVGLIQRMSHHYTNESFIFLHFFLTTSTFFRKWCFFSPLISYVDKFDALRFLYSVFFVLMIHCLAENMSSEQRRENYLCDITYVTNSELGFDYLRDNLAMESIL